MLQRKNYESWILLAADWPSDLRLTKLSVAHAMAPSLVAAYASDSDEDEAVPNAAQEQVETPAPRASGLALPPPKKGGATKRQIHVDLAPAPQENEPAPAKRPRMQAQPGAHGLLSMLPTPSAAKPAKPKEEARVENSVEDDARLSIVDDAKAGEAKGNNDFRAMLGLAPKSAPKTERAKPVILNEPAREPPAEKQDTIPHDTPTTGFFAPGVDENAGPSARPSSSFRVSAAPDVEAKAPEPEPEPEVDLQDQYPGWRCDPDGSWYPVTPEAHAQYAAWAQHAEAEAAERAALQSKSDAMPDPSKMHTFDAGEALQSAEHARPPPPVNKKPKVEWQISDKLQSERLTNTRARNRGQLSALLAQAQESRDVLEEKWAQGKAKRRENSKRYGF